LGEDCHVRNAIGNQVGYAARSAARRQRRLGLALLVIATAQLMVVLDRNRRQAKSLTLESWALGG
jgi:hypothetical protein